MKLDTLIAPGNDDAALLPRPAAPPLALALGAISALIIRAAREGDRPQGAPALGCCPGVPGTGVTAPGDADDAFAARPGEDGDADSVLRLRVAEGGAELALRLGPDQAGDLGEDVDQGERGAAAGVEEVDLSVVAAAPRGEEAGLPGCEGDRFDRGGVGEGVGLDAGRVVEKGWSCGGWR